MSQDGLETRHRRLLECLVCRLDGRKADGPLTAIRRPARGVQPSCRQPIVRLRLAILLQSELDYEDGTGLIIFF